MKLFHCKKNMLKIFFCSIILASSIIPLTSNLASCSKKTDTTALKQETLNILGNIANDSLFHISYLTFEEVAVGVLEEKFDNSSEDNLTFKLFFVANEILYKNHMETFNKFDTFEILINSSRNGDLKKISAIDVVLWEKFNQTLKLFKEKLRNKESRFKNISLSLLNSIINKFPKYANLKFQKIASIIEDNYLVNQFIENSKNIIGKIIETIDVNSTLTNINYFLNSDNIKNKKDIPNSYWSYFCYTLYDIFEKVNEVEEIKKECLETFSSVSLLPNYETLKDLTLFQISEMFSNSIETINELAQVISNISNVSVSIYDLKLSDFLNLSNELQENDCNRNLWSVLEQKTRNFKAILSA